MKGVKDISLSLYDDKGNLTHCEIYFKKHSEFSAFTKVLVDNDIKFDVVSAYFRDKKIEEINRRSR